jgi:hypothetical protein
MDKSLTLIILKHSVLCWVQSKTAHSSEGNVSFEYLCMCG